jgi:hypothetical protein
MVEHSIRTPILQISQGHLSLFDLCPRKFQYTYLEQLLSPLQSEQHKRLSLGNQFHVLMQQRELGLSIQTLAAQDLQLQRWVAAFEAAEPEIIGTDNGVDRDHSLGRYSEHVLTLYFQDVLLMMVCDLLIVYPDRVQILDWKTYPRPQNRQRLARHWQTRLYLFIVAETMAYEPEQIAMTYWFFQTPDTIPSDPVQPPEPQALQFNYNHTLHEETRRDLARSLNQLQTGLQAYDLGESFPQVSAAAGMCPTCQFALHCQRHAAEPSSNIASEFCIDLDQIPEITL